VVFAVWGEDTAYKLLREGERICGNRYTVERYQEERPDIQCINCAKWGYRDSKYNLQTKQKCSLCIVEYRRDQYQYQVVVCMKGKGQ
jgi:hypothetical protein